MLNLTAYQPVKSDQVNAFMLTNCYFILGLFL